MGGLFGNEEATGFSIPTKFPMSAYFRIFTTEIDFTSRGIYALSD